MISLQSISKHYHNEAVLTDISLDIRAGEFLTLLGPSGCGKTTLLRLLAGFVQPGRGRILFEGRDLLHQPPEQRPINLVFQNYALFPHLSVFENIAFGLRCEHRTAQEINERVQHAIAQVKLEGLAHKKPHDLSGGQQQRVAIARAIVKCPQVLLLDEPLSALDHHLRRQMQIELKALQRRLGITFIMVTHDQEEALALSDRIAVMQHGHIQQLGTPREVYEQPNQLSVAHFIGDANVFRCQVQALKPQHCVVTIAGQTLALRHELSISTGEHVNVVIRPEDFTAWGQQEVEHTDGMLDGHVKAIIYKGSTVDLSVELKNGQWVNVTEFFDEDDETLEYKLNERVWLEWQPGWEVVLADELESSL